ncbi:MAG TPA: amidohydrolase family protein [Vicinamibacterales bacterium]|nr:amidohydrolase family protein [Vicinamibacterales bacterium]
MSTKARYAGIAVLTVALAAAVTTVMGGAAADQDAAGVSDAVLHRFKIDCHVHQSWTDEGIQKTLDAYRKYNTMACAFGTLATLDRAKEHPDVFIPFGTLRLSDPNALQLIDQYHAAGFKGVGELMAAGRDYDDPVFDPIWARLQQYHMVAVLHTGIVNRRSGRGGRGRRGGAAGAGRAARAAAPPNQPEGSSWLNMHPGFLDVIARRYPTLILIGAHLGNPWYAEAAEGARWSPNLYFDISGSSLIKKASHPEYWGDVFWWRPDIATGKHSPGGTYGFEKLVFASDEAPDQLLPNIQRFERMLDANNVPETVRANMWAGTVAKILGVQEHAAPAH